MGESTCVLFKQKKCIHIAISVIHPNQQFSKVNSFTVNS